jgi:hypothetical protein
MLDTVSVDLQESQNLLSSTLKELQNREEQLMEAHRKVFDDLAEVVALAYFVRLRTLNTQPEPRRRVGDSPKRKRKFHTPRGEPSSIYLILLILFAKPGWTTHETQSRNWIYWTLKGRSRSNVYLLFRMVERINVPSTC